MRLIYLFSLLPFYLPRRPAEDIPAHAYLHERLRRLQERPEPVGQVEDPDLVREDGEVAG